MKKNTLLYLNDELVKAAKKRGINISKITEYAIRGNLFPFLSAGEKATLDSERYLKMLEEEKRCFFLPFEIKAVELNNIGPCLKLNLSFDKFNIITGGNGTGKTTLIRSIAYLCGHGLDESEIINQSSKEGSIVLKISAPERIVINFKKNLSPQNNAQCILIDDGLARLTEKQGSQFLKYLKKSGKQVILTSIEENILLGDIEKEAKITNLSHNILLNQRH